MDRELIDLSKYRLEQAERCIRSARLLGDDDDFKGAANRSYYAIFHGMRSVLALERKDFARHSGVSAYFRKTYIKTGVFPVEMSDYIREAFDIREESDYDDFYAISREEVIEQIENAEKFLNTVKDYLQGVYEELSSE